MTTTTYTDTITAITREKNTHPGNPVYSLTFSTHVTFKTLPNALCAYTLTGNEVGKEVTIELTRYHGSYKIKNITVNN